MNKTPTRKFKLTEISVDFKSRFRPMEKKSFNSKGDWFKGRPEEKDDLYDLGNDDLEEKEQKEEAA